MNIIDVKRHMLICPILMCREKIEVVMRKEMRSKYELSLGLSKDDRIKNYVKSPIL